MISMLAPNCGQLAVDRHGDRLGLAPEDQRDQEVVPRPEELKDGQRGDGGQAEGQDQAQEDADLRGAVDAGGLEQVLGDAYEEVAEQEDGERQAEGGVEEDQGENRVVDPERLVEPEHRDERHLQRHDEERDHDHEEPVSPGEIEPRERVAGEGADEDGKQRAADRDPDRRHERRGDRLVVEDRRVVLERELARLREDLPPAAFEVVLRREQRGQEEADRRNEPEQADDHERDVHRRTPEEMQEAAPVLSRGACCCSIASAVAIAITPPSGSGAR